MGGAALKPMAFEFIDREIFQQIKNPPYYWARWYVESSFPVGLTLILEEIISTLNWKAQP